MRADVASCPPNPRPRALGAAGARKWPRVAAQNKQEYGAESITVLEGLEAVRKRPGMYIGSTGERGLHHLVWEVVDNAVDEALAGYCDTIDVVLLADGGVRVTDNGRGFPVDLHPKLKKPGVEVALTVLHAGGKFDGKAYAVSGGLHGVGVSVVNALSTRMAVEIHKAGFVWRQQYTNSKPGPLEKGETDRPHRLDGLVLARPGRSSRPSTSTSRPSTGACRRWPSSTGA